MVIKSHLDSGSAARMLAESSSRIEKSLSKLASGSRIDAADEPSSNGFTGRFEAHIKRIEKANSEISSAISFSQAQDGFLNKISDALVRMNELSILASSSKATAEEKASYQTEFAGLQSQIADIGTKDFGGVSLFGGPQGAYAVTIDSKGTTFALAQASFADRGANTVFGDVLSSSVRLDTGSATLAYSYVTTALNQVTKDEGTVGANLNRLQYASDLMAAEKEYATASKKGLLNADESLEMARFVRNNILTQSGTAMLAQANITPQLALSLLR